MIKIRDLEIEKNIFLAPMAGVTDLAFRHTVSDFGAGLTYSEMVSAKALHYKDKRTARLLATSEEEPLFAVQLFGRDPEIMAEAAGTLDMADVIDINLGCPAPKIIKNGEGSALLREPELVGKIVRAVVRTAKQPVTVKIRSGWDETCINALEIAKVAEESGASAVMVHGRTTRQQYSGRADWGIIGEVKKALNIPVIGNGDVASPQDALMMIEKTGVDGVAVGRGTLGRPWIIGDIIRFLECGEEASERGFEERVRVAMRHFERMVEYKGEKMAVLEARKHAAWYLKGIPGAAEMRRKVVQARTMEEMKEIMQG